MQMDSWLNKKYGIKPFFKKLSHARKAFIFMLLNTLPELLKSAEQHIVIWISYKHLWKTFYTIMVLFSTSIPYNSSNAPLMLSERNTKTVVLPKFQTSRKFFWALNHLLFYLCLLAKTDRLKVKTVGFYPSISLLWQREE